MPVTTDKRKTELYRIFGCDDLQFSNADMKTFVHIRELDLADVTGQGPDSTVMDNSILSLHLQ